MNRVKTEDLITNPFIIEFKDGIRDIVREFFHSNEKDIEILYNNCENFLDKLNFTFFDITDLVVENSIAKIKIDYIFNSYDKHSIEFEISKIYYRYSHTRIVQ